MSELFSLFYVVIPFSVFHRLYISGSTVYQHEQRQFHINYFRVVWKLMKSTAAGTLGSLFFPSQPAVPKALLQDKILSRFPSVSCPSGPCAVWWLGSQGTGAQCPVLVWVLGLCQSRAKGQVSVLSAVRRGALYLSFTPAGHVLACLGYYLKERHHFFFWLPFKLFICHCIL